MPPRNGKSSGAGGSAPQPLPASPRAAARRQSTKGGREVDGSDYEEEAEEEEEGEEEEAGGEGGGQPEKTATDAQGPEPPQQKRFKFPGKLGCEADVALLLQVRVARTRTRSHPDARCRQTRRRTMPAHCRQVPLLP
jgi:hypothetical protein